MAAAFSVNDQKIDLDIDSTFLCTLCLQVVPLADTHTLIDCKCVYCKACIKQYLTISVEEGQVLKIYCPDGACTKPGVIRVVEMEQFLEECMFERYKKMRFEKEVALDPSRTFCPEVGCETICHVCSKDRKTKSANPVHCHTCGLMFCSVCKAKWHGSQSCDDFMKSGPTEDVGVPFSASEDAAIKRCPMCHVPIERNDGCAQMMCRRCKHVFCWYCLQSLDEDFLLRHYDKGPCKNRLGHSRASVIWHRAQVVGIFAGFGILLLLASPFLLLAAPCILCCKCKVCRCCDDDDPGSPEGLSSM